MLDSEKMLNDSALDEVNGGFGGGIFMKLPSHACGNGETGELERRGPFLGAKTRYVCKKCHKEGRINHIRGTRQYCELI